MIEDRPIHEQSICPMCGSDDKATRKLVEKPVVIGSTAMTQFTPCPSFWHVDEIDNAIIGSIPRVLLPIARQIHALNHNWWVNPRTGEPLQRNVGETLMLVVTELSEALEGYRKGLHDDKLLHRMMFEVEIMDAIIRLLDLCAGFDDQGNALQGGLDFGAMVEKLEYNRHRADHKIENRLKEHGKKF